MQRDRNRRRYRRVDGACLMKREAEQRGARERQEARDPVNGYPSVNMRRCIYPIGSAVVALIFSMAKRDVTFLSGTVAIRRL